MEHILSRAKESSPESPKLRPPLKWAGGKRWLVPHLKTLWLPFRDRRLVEPFCGGLAVALGLNPRHALLNDINVHLVNFYRCLQKGLVARIPMRNEHDLYYVHRDAFNELIERRGAATKKAAQLFYFLNRTGFNGLCRFNKRGRYNVPFGSYTKIRYTRDFGGYASVLAPWTFPSLDFSKLEVGATDFIYADPPYDVSFTSYAPSGFNWDDQVRLARWLAEHQGPVVLSNQATERVEELYRSLDFQLHFLHAPRMINSTGDRTPAREILAVKGLRTSG